MRNRLILAHGINNFLFNQFRFFGSRKIGRFISKLLLPPLSDIAKVPTIYNFDMFVNANGGKEIYNLGFYEVGTIDVIQQCLLPTDNFVDVGASIGLMSLVASKKCSRGMILAFEPQKERFEILKKNVELNDCKNIQAFNNGLGENNEQLQLHTDIFSPSIVDVENSNGNHELIDILVLDEVLENKGINTIKFIKMDVEGFELNVLKGARSILSKKDAPIICVEYVKRLQLLNQGDVSMVDFIKSINDYRLFQLEKSSNSKSKLLEVSKEEDLRDCDNIYCFLDYHIQNLNFDKLFK
jgi:FkbM family methyltransferase